MYAIELTLDPASDLAIRAAWAHMGRSGYQTPADQGFRPHLSLGLYGAMDEAVASLAVERFAAQAAMALTLTGVEAFYTDPGVVFLAPGPSAELIALQRAVQEVVLPVAVVDNPHSAPAVWRPHITLADQIDSMRLVRALATARAHPVPGQVRTESLRLMGLRPSRIIASCPVG